MSNDQFIADDYTPPVSGGGFSKIEQGDNTFRILSSPLLLWVVWEGSKPTRLKYNKENKPATPPGERDSVKHAWAMVVWNYQTKKIEVMELDKATIIKPLLANVKNKAWGHPKHYDVIFNKKGSGKDGTEYGFTPIPPSKASQEIIDAFLENPIDLNQLLVEGGNPFLESQTKDAAPTQPVKPEAPKLEEAPKVEEEEKKGGLPF